MRIRTSAPARATPIANLSKVFMCRDATRRQRCVQSVLFESSRERGPITGRHQPGIGVAGMRRDGLSRGAQSAFDSDRAWMIRSYVLTWSFVSCRLIGNVAVLANVGDAQPSSL